MPKKMPKKKTPEKTSGAKQTPARGPHTCTNPEILKFKEEKYITKLQYEKLSEGHLLQIGRFNSKNKHVPQPSVKGKTNKDYKKKRNKSNFEMGTASDTPKFKPK